MPPAATYFVEKAVDGVATTCPHRPKPSVLPNNYPRTMKSLLRSCQLALALALSVGIAAAQVDSTDTDDDSDDDGMMACTADAGMLSAVNPNPNLGGDGVRLLTERTAPTSVPDGYEVAYVLTYFEDGKNILGDVYTSLDEAFVTVPNRYRLHTFVAELSDPDDPNYVDLSVVEFGITAARDVLALLGEAGICAALELPGAAFDVVDCDVTGGLIFSQNGTNEISVCPADGPVQVVPSYEVTAQAAYVIADDAYEIVAVTTDPASVAFGDFAPGTYNIFLVTYTGTLNEGLAGSVYTQRYSDNCFLISDNEIIVRVGAPDAGEVVTTEGGDQVAYVCSPGDGVKDVIGFSNPGAADLEYAYVVTDTAGTIIGLPATAYADFDGAGPGICWVYGVSYTGELLLALGDNIATADVATGCADVTDGFIAVIRGETDGGTLAVGGSDEQIVLDSSSTDRQLLVEATTSAPGPQSYAYFLLDSTQTVVEVSEDGAFDLAGRADGKYFAYGLGYTGALLRAVGDNFFGGGPKSDACFDQSDNAIVIVLGGFATGDGDDDDDDDDDDGDDDDGDCPIDAGNLIADNPVATIGADGSVVLTASVDTAPSKFDGCALVYLLTTGDDLDIVGASLQPGFEVGAAGTYRIHAFIIEQSDLVGLDALSLASEAVGLGGLDAAALLAIVESRDLCADLSAGAPFEVSGEGLGLCLADAGTVSSGVDTIFLEDGIAAIAASEADAPRVPVGSSLGYVLTMGDNLTIKALGLEPAFTVDAAGDYRIHPIVAPSVGDPTLLAYFNALFAGNPTPATALIGVLDGTTLCYDLDAAGALVTVAEMMPGDTTATDTTDNGGGMGGDDDDDDDDEDDGDDDDDDETEPPTAGCAADAGTLAAANPSVALGGASAVLTATIATPSNESEDLAQIYLLTSGENLAITGASFDPSFSVGLAGTYRIHSLVVSRGDLNEFDLGGALEDPAFLLQLIGFDAAAALQLIEENDICADLSAGTVFTVTGEGPGYCQEVSAGNLMPVGSTSVELGGGVAEITAVAGSEQPMVPAGHTLAYLLSTGTNLALVAVNSAATFEVSSPGVYTIHALVLPDIISETTIAYLNDLFAAQLASTEPILANTLITALNVAGVCYNLDIAGASFEVGGTEGLLANPANVDFDARPNGEGVLVQLVPHTDGTVATDVRVSLTDFTGRVVATRDVGDVSAATSVTLPAGQSSGMHAVSVQSSTGIASRNLVLE